MQDCLAIDFGTSNSLAVCLRGQDISEPLPIDPDHDDPSILRSVLYSPRKGEWEFGEKAIARYYEEGAEGRIFRSLKKFLPDPAFQGTEVHGVYHSLEDLLSRLMRCLKERAEAHEQRIFTGLMCGHPALFSDSPNLHLLALQRLQKAAQLAGFSQVYFCPEPVAAASHFLRTRGQAETLAIADFGGGTSDFTVVRMQAGRAGIEKVLSLGGLSIAGDAFDSRIMERKVAPYFGSQISYRVPFGSNVLSLPKGLIKKMCSPADLLLLAKKDYREFFEKLELWSLSPDTAVLLDRLQILIEEREGYHLFQRIEEAKKDLKAKDPSLISYQYPGIDLKMPLERGEFCQFSEDLVQALMKCFRKTIAEAGLSPEDIDTVCCTGGSARLDILQSSIRQDFAAEKIREHLPFHAVVRGLGEQLLLQS